MTFAVSDGSFQFDWYGRECHSGSGRPVNYATRRHAAVFDANPADAGPRFYFVTDMSIVFISACQRLFAKKVKIGCEQGRENPRMSMIG
jgi:hypothetical protein